MLKYQVKLPYIARKLLLPLLLMLAGLLLAVQPASAAGQVLGIHLLHPDEIKQFRQVFPDDQWRYVTIPLTLNDLQRHKQWQEFFDLAYSQKVTPIVRLATRFDSELNAWQIPSKKDIIDLVTFLSSLDWHQAQRHVIVFNEVNHANEWGGQLDPAAYARTLRFTSNWLKTESKNYLVLPAALDLATSSDSDSLEAFAYLNRLYQSDPEVFSYIDFWNSHSYPNPGFESPPQRNAKNSLRGFTFELNFLKQKTGRDFQVFITETGWMATPSTGRYLSSYYLYALQHIWNDPRVVAVTPFVMRGSPGPFAEFSFFDANNLPTIQLFALQHALKQLVEE